jgi:ribosomal protein S27E
MSELHRCHRGARCADHETDAANPALKRGAPINPTHGLCDPCTRLLHRSLLDIPQDYLDLEVALTGCHDSLRELVAATPELPVPISLTLAAVQAELLHEAQCWAESTAEVLGVWWDTQHARDSRPGAVLDRASRLLSRSISAFLALRDVVHATWLYGVWTTVERDGLDGALVFLDLHQRVRALTGQRRLVNHLPVPCPDCERTALTRDDGSETIECGACGQRLTWDQYEQSCTLLARIESAA